MTTAPDPTPALKTLHTLLPPSLRAPRVGIVCGSGLSTLARSLRDVVEVPYEVLEGFARSTVQGHRSALAFGLMGPGDGVPVVAMLGRFHAYEGHPLSSVIFPVRVLAALGVRELIITNAAGGLNPDLPVGSIVVIQDHLALPNLTGPLNALFGPALPTHTRFLPLSTAYSPRLARLAFLSAHSLNFAPDALAEGVYAWVSGPTYETPAEGRFLRAAGADVVGMSTVPEVVAACAEGLEVLVLSLVTNGVDATPRRSVKAEVEAELAGRKVDVKEGKTVSHEEVLEVGRAKAEEMRRLVERIVEMVHES